MRRSFSDPLHSSLLHSLPLLLSVLSPIVDLHSLLPSPIKMAQSPFYETSSSSSHFPFASTSKALPTYQWQRPLTWSTSTQPSGVTYPFDDCLPISPASHFRSKYPSFPSQPFHYARPSELDSYQFSHGLPTPDSSRPSSPSSQQLKPTSQEDLYLEDRILLDPLTLGDDYSNEEEEEDDDEELFRRKMMMERRENEFDGDMEEWNWTMKGDLNGGDCWKEREDWNDSMEE